MDGLNEGGGPLRADETAGEETCPPFDLNRFLPYLLNRAGSRLVEIFSEELRRRNLTLPMWRVMAVLWHKGEQRIIDLTGETSIEQSTLSRLLATMDGRGLVSRNRNRSDGRAVLVTLTTGGKELTAQLIPIALRNERAVQNGLTAEEIRFLHSMLRRIFDNSADLKP